MHLEMTELYIYAIEQHWFSKCAQFSLNFFTCTRTQSLQNIHYILSKYTLNKNTISIITSIILFTFLIEEMFLSLALTNNKIVLWNVFKVLHFKGQETLFQAVISRKHDI